MCMTPKATRKEMADMLTQKGFVIYSLSDTQKRLVAKLWRCCATGPLTRTERDYLVKLVKESG